MMLSDLMEFTLKVTVPILTVIFAPILIASGATFVASLVTKREWVVGGIALITYITMLSLFIVVGVAGVTD